MAPACRVGRAGLSPGTRVDAPGEGPRMTVEQTPAPQWQPVQRWAHAELTEPSPGTQVF
jgi:hypothetical protein